METRQKFFMKIVKRREKTIKTIVGIYNETLDFWYCLEVKFPNNNQWDFVFFECCLSKSELTKFWAPLVKNPIETTESI